MKVLILLLSIIPWQNMLQEAKQHYANYQNDSCAIKIAEVRDYCLSHPDDDGVLELSVEVENVLGALAQVAGQRDSAEIHYRNAYDCVMRLEDRTKAPVYCINLADVLRQVGNAPEAAQWLRRAMLLSDSLSTHNLNCAINTQLGQVYSDLRNFSVAEEFFDMAEKSCEKGSFDDYFLANARGNSCFFNEDYSSAVSFFRRARETSRQMGNEFNQRVAEINLGECYLSLHQLDSAGAYINSSYDFWSKEKYCDESILTAIRGMKAGLALEKGDIGEAQRWLSYGSGGPGTSPIYTNNFNRHMMEISALKEDWKRAYEYSLKIKNYSDSLLRNILSANFTEAEMRYSRDTTVLHQQLRIAGQNARIMRLGGGIAVAVLALIVCLLVILRIQTVRKREEKRTEEIINNLKLENLKKTAVGNRIVIEDASQDRFVPVDEMVLFTYNPDTRKWQVLLKNGEECIMKRGTTADKILEISPCFVKLNQQSIVNVDYIKSIGVKDQRCILVEPFGKIDLFFSRRSARMMKQNNPDAMDN